MHLNDFASNYHSKLFNTFRAWWINSNYLTTKQFLIKLGSKYILGNSFYKQWWIAYDAIQCLELTLKEPAQVCLMADTLARLDCLFPHKAGLLAPS